MKITYLKLENVAGIAVGQQQPFIEIDFTRTKHRIISIQAKNSSGKTTLLSSLHPFASATSLDERSSLSYITPGKNGFKEIRYDHNGSIYIIKHYFKATKDSHSVKSYFQCNGEELNENGNVGSFLSLVEIHFGLTPDMLRLIRLGSNVNSFISLKPAERKSYVGKLIDEIDLYLKIHRKINDDLRLTKLMITTNSTSLQSCHIDDITVEGEKLISLQAKHRDQERERDQLRLRISKIESSERENNVEELVRKREEAKASLLNFQQAEQEIVKLGLENASVDELIAKHNKLSEQSIDLQSQLKSIRLMIDANLARIDDINSNIRRLTSNSDLESMLEVVAELRQTTDHTDDIVKEFRSPGCTSDDTATMISKLSSLNQVGTMINSFGSKATSVYLQLTREKKSIDNFIAEHTKRKLSNISDSDLKNLMDQVFQDDQIISPNCDEAFVDCPYYRLSSVINEYRSKVRSDICDEDVLRYLKVIATNIDTMRNEIDHLRQLPVPQGFKEILREKVFLSRLENKLPLFDLSDLRTYHAKQKASEVYRDQLAKLKQYEQQLSIYKSSGIDQQTAEVERLQGDVNKLQSEIGSIETNIRNTQQETESVGKQIGLLNTFNDGKKYRSIVENTIADVNRILQPLESGSKEKVELGFRLTAVEEVLGNLGQEIKELEQRIDNYKRLIAEGKKLSSTYDKLSIIMTSVSTKKGIPLIYMNAYLERIQTITNNLLSIVYDGELVVDKFNITADEFEIPFVRNGTKISDVRYASQSELALVTMALSFALAHGVNQNYNILLLDEVDAGLDEDNRLAFLQMFEQQMSELKAEQAFIISHNMSNMIGVPMGVIKLSNIEIRSKLHSVIYPLKEEGR